MRLLKFTIWILCALALSLAAGVCRAANDVIPPRIFPQPLECVISSTQYVPLEKIAINSSDTNSIEWAEKHLKGWYGKYAPKVMSIEMDKADESRPRRYILRGFAL